MAKKAVFAYYEDENSINPKKLFVIWKDILKTFPMPFSG